ncbi:hypothetical protein FRC08_002818 [Ceratobasidium sp. 394]|nr:hypothetical protein FRC08_002818 [Ceratobasidium sp. 394]
MIGMEYAASKASSKPPTLASSASSTHSTKPNGQSPATPRPDTEDDPRTQLIETLRTQLTDVHTQLSQLNSKLVQSYDRVSHLEDSLEVANNTLSTSKARVSELEAQQTAHEAALETGVLVEREHVAHELSRLMERATEEAAQRGEADAARSRIETELDDLSADLFGRANTMVAEARIARAASERRVEEAENALKGAEVAVKGMQIQMQQMAEARRAAEEQVAEMRARMDKGKWVDRDDRFDVDSAKRRLYNSHNVYREFTTFISHLRGLRAANGVVPQMSALLSLPFIARLVVEDCDPTLRLDLAPALNWLTRRAVHAAVLQGQLEIEPVYGLLESECALCGLNPHGSATPSGSAATSPTTASHTLSPRSQSTGATSMAAWASTTSKYLKGSLSSPTTSPHPNQPPAAPPQIQRAMTDPNAPPVYIFRIAGAQTTAGATPMALCSGGWCLARLRTTCELCAFIRRGVVEKVWSEAPIVLAAPPPVSTNHYIQGLGSMVSALGRDKDKDTTHAKEKDPEAPPVPPRRRQLSSLGSSIWEKGLGAFGGSRSGSRSGTPAPEETKELSPKLPHRVPPLSVPNDTKPTTAPPPPPPRARPVPPPPAPAEPESKPDPVEHHEEIHHATVFDATADEHGHHAVSPMTDKQQPIPPPVRAPNAVGSPKLESVPLPPVEEPTPAAEPTPKEPPAPAPAAETETPVAPPPPAPETPRRPPRTRQLVQDSNKPPTSPRVVALPDSRPGTPAPDERPSTPSPSVAARAISPTPGASPSALRRTGSLRKDADSGRASSPVPGDGTPPKIPRRAPRRVAPIPPGTPPAPSAAPDAEKVEEKEPKVEEEKTEDSTTKVEEKPAVPRPPPRRAVPPPPAPPVPARAMSPKPAGEIMPTEEKPVEEAKPEETNTEVKPIEETKSEVKPAEEVKLGEENKPTETKPVQETKPDEPATAPVETVVTSATTGNIAQSKPATAPALRSDKPTDADKKPVLDASGEKTASDDGQFVGEQSWEERAYKEIVKLREDMFWARIGSAW